MKRSLFPLALVSVFALSGCQTVRRTVEALTPSDSTKITSDVYEFTSLPVVGDETLGGFSALLYDGIDAKTGDWLFTTTTDRGPNLEERHGPNGEVSRPFRAPGFPVQWFRFALNTKTKTLSSRGQVELRRPDGATFTGLPNVLPGEAPGGGDEIGVDLKGNLLKTDPMGIDTESLARDPDGTVWMGEEYRPSVLHFTKDGHLLSRWVPEGSASGFGTPLLPTELLNRRLNRGFEGLALARSSVYAFLQTGLKGDQDISRIYQIDRATGQPQGIFVYPFEPTPRGWTKVDKIGDAAADGHGGFFVIEQNGSTKSDAFRRIYRIEIANATNLLHAREGVYSAANICATERVSERPEACVIAVKKTFVADLTELGLADIDKAEGLARIDDQTIAVVNDNDFTEKRPRLVIIHLPKLVTQ